MGLHAYIYINRDIGYIEKCHICMCEYSALCSCFYVYYTIIYTHTHV